MYRTFGLSLKGLTFPYLYPDTENCAAWYLYMRGNPAFIRWACLEEGIPGLCLLLLRWLRELIHLTSGAHAASSPARRCIVWLALSGQQLQEEEMETLHCHRVSFSAKEQLIPETASRGKRLSKDSRRKRQTNSNDQPPLGQGVVSKQSNNRREWGGWWRLLGKQNVPFQPFRGRDTRGVWESWWDTSPLSRTLSVM